MTTEPIALPECATLLGAVLYLMTKYAERGCPSVRRAIQSHLNWLACHPSAEVTGTERARYAKLAALWAALDTHTRPKEFARSAFESAIGRVLQ